MIPRGERPYRWLAGLFRIQATFDPAHRHPHLGKRVGAYARRQRGTRRSLVRRVNAAQEALQEQRRQTLRTAEVLDMAVELLPAAARANREEFAEIQSRHQNA